jgi:hypothetical protein
LDIYFDEESGSDWLTDWWDRFIQSVDSDHEIYGNRPEFRNDEEFLPLQAADFWAWWVRRGYETNTIKQFREGNFGSWKGPKGPPALFMQIPEDSLTEYFIDSFLQNVPIRSMANIYDAKKTPKSEHAIPAIVANSRAGMLSHLGQLLRRFRGK